MDYYYSKNNSKPNKNIPYYHKEKTALDSYYSRNSTDINPNKDTLIIDGNTVYEIDEECFKKHLQAKKASRINSKKNWFSNKIK